MSNRFAELETQIESDRHAFIDRYDGTGENMATKDTAEFLCELSRDLQHTVSLLAQQETDRQVSKQFADCWSPRTKPWEWLVFFFLPLVGMFFACAVCGTRFQAWLSQP